MGMDLSGNNRNFRFNMSGWSWIIRLAVEYGWNPKGTKPGSLTKDLIDGNWDGNYFSNMFQEVGASDALNIACALEKAINDIPDKKMLINFDKEAEIRTTDYWSGKEGKAYIRDFIVFCKEGPFVIG